MDLEVRILTEEKLRQQLVDQAKSWLGRKEADGTHRVIVDVYNSITPLPRGYRVSYSDPWCATFVSACAQVWGLTGIVYPECSCPKMIELYRKAGRWMEDDSYLPQPADVIFYDWQDTGAGDNTGTADHVGVVVEVDGETITVMEGNCGKAVATRQLQRNGRYIRGFGLPDYAAAASAINAHEDPEDDPPAAEVPEEPVSIPDTPATVTLPAPPKGWGYALLPIVKQGDESEAVRAMQLLLRGRGFRCGWTGADGEFGTRTARSLKDYQIDRQLPCKPEAGPEVWEKLICD